MYADQNADVRGMLMEKLEVLKGREMVAFPTPESHHTEEIITKEEVESLYQSRKQSLERIRGVICLKFYYTICEKLDQEKKYFDRILHIEDTKLEALSRYSFVLNPYYFEQKFF